MSVSERDPHTGHMTTGHEWNGIKELNTPVPKPVFFFLGATFLFAIVYWVLMPAFPLGVTYTKGLLGLNDRAQVEEMVKQASIGRAGWTDRIATASVEDIQADPALMTTVRATGKTLFGDNCSVCHGREAKGGKGYPNLAQAPMLWGDAPENIMETIRVGINSDHPETRYSQMLAFGRDQMLGREEIGELATYLESLSASADNPAPTEKGIQLFADNCAGCHGADAKGMVESGAPDLTDAFWLYGGEREDIRNTLFHGRQGHMPQWETRLSEVDRRILALYILDLRTSEQ